jgi:hypothetical protein
VLVGLFLCVSAPAFAARGVVGAFGVEGTGPGQFASPSGVAVRQSTGEVYVVDSANDRVEVFQADGAYAFQFGLVGSAAGQLSDPQGVAVEQLTGDVYVTDQGNRRVDEFEGDGAFVRAFGWGVSDGVAKAEVCTSACQEGLAGFGAGEFGASIGYPAVNPTSGDVYVADPANSRIQRFEGDGTFISQFGGLGSAAGQFAAGSPTQLAIDGSGDVYAIDGEPNLRVQELDSVGAPVAVFASAYLSGSPSPSSIAVEPTLGDILLAKTPPASSGLLREENGALMTEELVLAFDPVGDLQSATGVGNRLSEASGMAVGATAENIYYVTTGCHCVLILNSTSSPAPSAEVQSTSVISSSEVTLHGTVNPMESSPNTLGTTYRLQYSTGEVNSANETIWNTVGEGKLQSGASPVAVSATLTDLQPNRSYQTRVIAEREYGAGSVTSQVGYFATLSEKPSISGESFSNVTFNSATISAQVNTGGLETTYEVQYGTITASGAQTPVVTTLAGESVIPVTVQLSALEPNTEYHFQIFAKNKDGNATGAELTFRTLPATNTGLSDERAYEMITPPENQNANAYAPLALGGGGDLLLEELLPTVEPFQVKSDGSEIAYVADATSGGVGKSGHALGDQYLATRGTDGGWSQSLIQPNGLFNTYFKGFSADLSVGIIQSGYAYEPRNLPLAPEAPGEGYRVMYARMNNDGAYRSLFTSAVRFNRSARAFGSNNDTYENGLAEPGLIFAGSAGSDDLLFEANDALLVGGGQTETELESDVKREVSEEVSLPEEAGLLREEAVKLVEKGEVAEATQKENEAAQKEAQARLLNSNYLYDWAGGQLGLVDVSPEGKVVPNATFGGPQFGGKGNPPDFSHAISANGKRIYWTDLGSHAVYLREGGATTTKVSEGPAQYWTASEDGRYAFYTEGKGEDGELFRFNAEPAAGQSGREALVGAGAGVLGVIGASENGENVYFVAEGVLSGENSEDKAPVDRQPNLYLLTHGGAPVFIATLSRQDENHIPLFVGNKGSGEYGDWIPGIGNRSARVTGDGGGVAFMSNQSLSVVGYPHGYQNNGLYEVYMYEANSNHLYCVSCGSSGEGPPTSSQGIAAFLPINWSDTYLPQWVSEDGDRVFFDSEVPLVPQDTNGKQDVYEWEREGSGSCKQGTGTTGGCVYLLSGGANEHDSWFVGASANGNDAFIVTRAQLLPEDGNEAFDLYDARVGGVKRVSPPTCTGTGCQGVPAPPPTFATPPSVTFSGVGNFTIPSRPAVKAKAKPLTRTQKLKNALKSCKRQKQGNRRASCEKQARKRYEVAKRAAKTNNVTKERRHV